MCKTIIPNQEITGVTGGALDSKEGETGPIYFSGDHGPIDLKSVVITPAKQGVSLAVTKTCGQVVSYGMAGGSLEMGNPLVIIGTSKTITGGDLWDYLTSREERIERSAELFRWITAGKIAVSPPTALTLRRQTSARFFRKQKKYREDNYDTLMQRRYF